MRGHIRRRGNKWAVVVDVNPDVSGRRRQRWHSGYATRRSAQVALTGILGRLQSGTYIEPSKATLAQYLEGWLGSARVSVRPATYATYATLCRVHIIPRLGATLLQRLGRDQLNAMYADLLENGRHDGKGGLAPRSVRHVHTTIHTALAAAVEEGTLARNVADLAKPPGRASSKEPATWTAEELRAFLEFVREDRVYALYHLVGTTGLRRGEALGVRWRDLDLDGARLSVSQTVVSVDYAVLCSEPKTQAARRSVALDPDTVRVLREQRKQQVEERLALGGYSDDRDLVFCNIDGGPLHPSNLSKRFDRLVKGAGVPRIRFHDLRHTHATLALRAGIHPKVVQERLGHATIAITLDTYSHAIPAMQEEAATKVAALVFG